MYDVIFKVHKLGVSLALPILMTIDGIGDKWNVCLTLQYKRHATLDVKRHPKYPQGRREPDGEENDSVTSKEVSHTITDGWFICAHCVFVLFFFSTS